jgi:hypothetical protein
LVIVSAEATYTQRFLEYYHVLVSKQRLDRIIIDAASAPQASSSRRHRSPYTWNTRPSTLMNSLIVSQQFKQVFAHRPCTACAALRKSLYSATQTRRIQTPPIEKITLESNRQQKMEHLPLDKLDEYKRHPVLTSDQLRTRKERPRRVRIGCLCGTLLKVRAPAVVCDCAIRLGQIVYTTPATATSRNKLLFCRRRSV